jgi:hypothetical protein
MNKDHCIATLEIKLVRADGLFITGAYFPQEELALSDTSSLDDAQEKARSELAQQVTDLVNAGSSFDLYYVNTYPSANDYVLQYKNDFRPLESSDTVQVFGRHVAAIVNTRAFRFSHIPSLPCPMRR